MLTLVDAFTGTAALGAQGRAGVVKALGARTAGIDRVPLGDLHDRRRRRHLVKAVVSVLADDEVLGALGEVTLGELAPGAGLLPDEDIGIHRCGAPLSELLARQPLSRWSSVLELRVSDVRAWPGVGASVTAEVVGLAVERGLEGLASVEPDAEPAAAAVDLAILLDHEQLGSRLPLVDALTELSCEGQPDTVRAAADRLLRINPLVADHARVLADILAAIGPPRDVDIFVTRTLTLGGRPTIETVARRFELSAERIRQIRDRANARACAAAGEAPPPFRALVGALHRWLGSVVPEAAADDVARRLGVGSTRAPTGGLLLWLAGPYRPVPGDNGWLALDPTAIVARTSAWLADDGGVRYRPELDAELAAEGVRAEHRDAWIASRGGIRVDDMIVNGVGGPAVLAERVLFATGRAMRAEEIATLLGVDDRTSEVQRILARDRRFLRVAPDKYELAEWGSTPAPERAPDATSIDGRWWLRVPVDAAVLRGACVSVPPALLDAARLPPSHRRTFASRYGPIALAGEGAVPACGPLRHIALACGAGCGDELWLGFDPAGDVSVRLIGRDERLGDDETAEARLFVDCDPVSLMARGVP